MKTYTKMTAVLTLLLSLGSFAGDKGGNGGDPFEINAVEFPDQAKLNQAIDLSTEKINQSNLPQDFKEAFIAEINNLLKNRKYQYLESIILLSSDAPEAYEIPTDAGKFLGLGAMTGSNKGEAIYFSSRSLKQTKGEFTKLLVHEVLHHVLTKGLSSDEHFVETLANETFSGEVSSQVLEALKRKVYPRIGVIYSNQLADTFVQTYDIPDFCMSPKILDWATGGMDQSYCKNEHPQVIYRRFLKDLPKNVAKMKVSKFIAKISPAAGGMSFNSPDPFGKMIARNFLYQLTKTTKRNKCLDGRSKCLMEDILK